MGFVVTVFSFPKNPTFNGMPLAILALAVTHWVVTACTFFAIFQDLVAIQTLGLGRPGIRATDGRNFG